MRSLAEFMSRDGISLMVRQALAEDIGPGDITTEACISPEAVDSALIRAKGKGVIAGLDFAREVFFQLDQQVAFEPHIRDGGHVSPGDVVCRVSGRSRALLTGERTALNFLGHLSGIATAAGHVAALTQGAHLTILDTRKTTPLLRQAEKYAVQAGGCRNHRTGLFDMVLIKENHIRAAGGISQAVRRARAAAPGLKVEVETTCEAEVREALAAGVDRIMLDNMDDAMIRSMLSIINGQAETEASGNMTQERIAALATSGLDYVSMGSLTHSVTVLDLSMLFERGGC